MENLSWKEVCEQPCVMYGLQRYDFRRQYSSYLLRQAGFTQVRVEEGWDGFEKGLAPFEKLGVKSDPAIRPGHQGCNYTHMKGWIQMIEEGVPFRIFFEDDVLPHAKIQELGEKFWKETPKDFDILYLGNMTNREAPQFKDPNALVVEYPSFCLHAYMLSAKGVKKIVDLVRSTNPITCIMDVQLVQWTMKGFIKSYCWNGIWTQKSYPTFDEGLPWQAFSNIILPQKDTGLFYQNFRLGTTLEGPTFQLNIPQYQR